MASENSKLDMTLDQLAERSGSSGRRGGRGGRRGGARGGRRQGDAGSFSNPLSRDDEASAGPVRRERTRQRADPYQKTPRGDVDANWKHDLHQAAEAKQTITHGQKLQASCTIVVANLDSSIRETDLEFFKEAGSMKDVRMFYDKNGRSLGQAEIVFDNAQDAEKAAVEFDNAEINGRPISVKVITEVGRQLTITKVARPEPVAAARSSQQARRGPRPTSSSSSARGQPQGQSRDGRRGGALRGGGRGGRPQGQQQQQQRKPKAPVSQASLDDDLDQYKTAAAAAAVPAQ